MADDYLVLTPFENMPADVAAKAQEAADKIKGGMNIFTGPLKDNEGNTVISAGEALDDGGLWGMNYYLEGVLGKIPG
jgi:simple sugar transport system substrate-binding protein